MIETVAKMTMLALYAAAAPLKTLEPSLWAQWGLAGVVVAYVLWRDWHREKRMGAAIDGQQKWIRETLVAALERSASATARNAAAMERMATWLERTEDLRAGANRRLRAVEDGDAQHG